MRSRPATAGDAEAIAQTIALAFADDPVWGPALTGDHGASLHTAEFWRFYIDQPIADGSAFLVVDDDTEIPTVVSVAVWILPGGVEMTDEQAVELARLIESALPERQATITELGDRFDANHPHDVPSAYLSLLATHPAHRGHGTAQQLLAQNLRQWDAQGLPAYLESTNPSNNHRYERAGFRAIGEFRSPFDDAPVATMWRNAQLAVT